MYRWKVFYDACVKTKNDELKKLLSPRVTGSSQTRLYFANCWILWILFHVEFGSPPHWKRVIIADKRDDDIVRFPTMYYIKTDRQRVYVLKLRSLIYTSTWRRGLILNSLLKWMMWARRCGMYLFPWLQSFRPTWLSSQCLWRRGTSTHNRRRILRLDAKLFL